MGGTIGVCVCARVCVRVCVCVHACTYMTPAENYTNLGVCQWIYYLAIIKVEVAIFVLCKQEK